MAIMTHDVMFCTGSYQSSECRPNVMECRLFHGYMKRKPTTSREAMKLVVGGRKSKNDQGLATTIRVSEKCFD